MGQLTVNKATYEALYNNQSLNLNHLEFDILWLLASRPGHRFSIEELEDEVWSQRSLAAIENIEAHVDQLAQKIGCGNIRREGEGFSFGQL